LFLDKKNTAQNALHILNYASENHATYVDYNINMQYTFSHCLLIYSFTIFDIKLPSYLISFIYTF